MLLHVLCFTKPETMQASTKTALDLLANAASNQGHELRIVCDHDCQMKFDGSAGLVIKGHRVEDIAVVFVRANLSGMKLMFRRTLIRQLELAGIKVVNKEEAVMNAKNKLRNLQVLTEHNIPVPKTYVINNTLDLDQALKDMGRFPVILKSPSGSQGKGVAIIESKRGLKSVIDMFDPSNPLIIQKYVKESKGKDLRVFIVGNRIVGAMERITTTRGEFRSNFHLGGRVLVADLSDDEKTLAIAASKACGLDVAGVDILRTHEGPKVIEVNANPGLEGITMATGKDIAGEIICFMVEMAGK
jgi:ribosomal protein S6--L-glutamate ligase